jgi:hypothetical protein
MHYLNLKLFEDSMLAQTTSTTRDAAYFSYLSYSLLLGLVCFFMHPNLAESFDSSNGHFEWYAIFSKEIFQPNYAYIAESVLLPLIAKFLGANSSLQSYRLLCSFVTILILPLVAIFAERRFKSIAAGVVLITFLALTFPYLRLFWLGYPDPLTIIFLAGAAFATTRKGLFVSALLAALTHFSIACLAIVGLAALLFTAPKPPHAISRKAAISSLFLGLVVAKIILIMWFAVFDYKLDSRLNIVMTEGLARFIEQGQRRGVLAFWLTPGISLLAGYLILFLIALTQRMYKFTVAMVFALSIAYLSVFFTIDDFRVFAVAVSAVYIFSLIIIVFAFSQPIEKLSAVLCAKIGKVYKQFTGRSIHILIALAVVLLWITALIAGDRSGILVNKIPFFLVDEKSSNLVRLTICAAGLFLFVCMIVEVQYRYKWLMRATGLVFWIPILVLIVQYLRRTFAADIEINLVIKLCSVALILIIGYGLSVITLGGLNIKSYFFGCTEDACCETRQTNSS